jgi:hypothetical protein
MGDKLYDDYIKALGTKGASIALSKGYIKALSRAEDTSEIAETPTMQVVARETFHQRVGIKRAEKQLEGHTQITQLKLCDGDGNTMFGRLATHLAGEARKLKQGDIIHIKSFTELTHKMGTSTAKPALFILGYSHVGYDKLPDDINPPLCCDISSKATNDDTEATPEGKADNVQITITQEDAECTHQNRLCSLYGISLLTCICKSNPVKKLDLNTIREDCFFADKTVEQMANNEKRCMIYWWYATNIYSICGKRKRRQLPNCLVKAVRDAYPEEDGVYVGFAFGD